MVATVYRCKNEQRRGAIRTALDAKGLPLLNGIDYLEVSSDQKTLLVYLIHPFVGEGLHGENVRIAGGTRLRDLRVEAVSVAGQQLTVRVNTPGDLSPYTLYLVQSPHSLKPLSGFDSQLSQVDFQFRVADLSEFDCQSPSALADQPLAPPPIDYLAKDYASFRQLMLDRLAVTLPEWTEKSPADLGILLVELVAYAADHLSYYQDAVATEAYLGTARKRVSVRRHARLLNYPMHDGCNACAWVALQVSPGVNGDRLPGSSAADHRPGTLFLTRVPDLPAVLTSVQEMNTALNAGSQCFETLHDLPLYAACNRLEFYTWGDRTCILPQGATRATLVDRDGVGQVLTPGKVLIFEEVRGPKTGLPADADPSHRQAVRLTSVEPSRDRLFGVDIVEIEWATEDALPLPLVISTVVNDIPIANVSVAWGNVVRVDHGRTVAPDQQVLEPIPDRGRYRPRLAAAPLTQQRYGQTRSGQWMPFDPDPSPSIGAAVLLKRDLQHVRPAIYLQDDRGAYWYPRSDLLNSDRFARDFVVETEEDGHAYLRFGDGVLGKPPEAGTTLHAVYRVGNGHAGNVGAEAIAHLFTHDATLQQAIGVGEPRPIRNPLPAKGGVDPEPIEQVRLDAPQAFRIQQRAVTATDYAAIAQRFPTVRQALATRRWTGSWYTIFITVDRDDGLPVDAAFKQDLTTFLGQFRLTAQDLEIEAPRFVPLDIALTVQVLPDYFRDQVKEVLLRSFSSAVLPDGRLGFFHPDRFTFGQSVYLSHVIQQAMQVQGVQSVTVTRFQRLGLPAQKELERGQIAFSQREIALLNNDPTVPEQGKMAFVMEGGI